MFIRDYVEDIVRQGVQRVLCKRCKPCPKAPDRFRSIRLLVLRAYVESVITQVLQSFAHKLDTNTVEISTTNEVKAPAIPKAPAKPKPSRSGMKTQEKDIHPQILTQVELFPPQNQSEGLPKKSNKLEPIVFRGGKYQAYAPITSTTDSPRVRKLKSTEKYGAVTPVKPRPIVHSTPTPQSHVSGFCRQCLLYGEMRKLAECHEHNYFPPHLPKQHVTRVNHRDNVK